jgi:transcriptional regulator with XRE-family HTH domain
MGRKVIGKCLLPQLLYNHKMTQVDLEHLTGISRRQISEYSRNERKMSLNNARLIAKALRCHIDDLYTWSE